MATVTDDEGSDSEESDSEESAWVEQATKGDSEDNETPQEVDFESHEDVAQVSFEDDRPLKRTQDELYQLHVRAGHLSFSKLRAMARRGEVPMRLAACESPMCAACKYGKATCKPWRTKSKNRKVKVVTSPGECVLVDQMESRAVGFVAQLKGTLTKGRYQVATIFVDHYSQLGYIHLQKDSTSSETLKAKDAFELYARERGVRIRHYHADNGRFVDNAWKEGLAQENQGITYCGVNAHWQNGIVERRIRDLKEQTRTMLLHSQHHWPEATSTSLWPYALRTACSIFNDAPTLKGDKKDQTPHELFTGMKISAEIRHHHTFGCPVYVLATPLQQGQSLAAWMARARVGVNLGVSPTHARSVSLVLSLKTGLVSPQFHVKHDDLFETTSRKLGGYSMPRSRWQQLSGFLKPKKLPSQREIGTVTHEHDVPAMNKTPLTFHGNATHEYNGHYSEDEADGVEDEPPPVPVPEAPPEVHFGADQDNANPSIPHPIEGTHGGTTRSGRRIKVTERARESQDQRGKKWVSWMADFLGRAEPPLDDDIYEIFAHQEYNMQDRATNPIAFSATSDPDTMYWHEAMREPDRAEFLKAAQAEVKSHVDNKHFVLRERKDLPQNTKVLSSVWSMKRKRCILSREVYKWKARLNAHGGQQEHGINFWETYSPVVNWFSIRLFLVISIIRGWETRQIDFVLAFPQADVECDIYMEIPQGFNLHGAKKKFCLQLKKNIYGTKQAGQVWNKHLHKGLTKLGYQASRIDPCVYYKGRTVFMLYVDDGIFAGPNESEVKELIEELKGEFDIMDEGDLTEYLGVLVEKQADGRTKLSQPHLIRQILDDLWFNEKTKSKPTPAPGGQVLQREIDAEVMADDFHYQSVVGKTNFLEKSTRPDIAVATHQCARFSSEPKQSHADALRYIGRYLQGTKDEGIYLDPEDGKSFECWVDADFLGQYVKDAPDMHLDKMTAK